MATENKRWDDNWCEVVTVEDGRPVRYASLARRSREDEPELAARIQALTGCAVRFGPWQQFEPEGKDFQSASEVELIVEPTPPSRDS